MTSPQSGRISVLLFARYAELLGASSVSVELAPGATIADVVAGVRALPGGDQLPDRPLCARNLAMARFEDVVTPGDELALLPPMAGG